MKDRDRAQLVLDDLDYLAKDWNQDIDDSSLRRSSTVLRSLLCEDHLQQIAHESSIELRILTPGIHRAMDEEWLKKFRVFQVGGGLHKGVSVQAVQIIDRALTLEEIQAEVSRTQHEVNQNYPVKLKQFLMQPCFCIEGVMISREVVILYIANKLGGAHYDPARKSNGAANDSSRDSKYVLLDSLRDKYSVADKACVYYELLSIGQRVVNSPDVARLRRHLRKELSQPRSS